SRQEKESQHQESSDFGTVAYFYEAREPDQELEDRQERCCIWKHLEIVAVQLLFQRRSHEREHIRSPISKVGCVFRGFLQISSEGRAIHHVEGDRTAAEGVSEMVRADLDEGSKDQLEPERFFFTAPKHVVSGRLFSAELCAGRMDSLEHCLEPLTGSRGEGD